MLVRNRQTVNGLAHFDPLVYCSKSASVGHNKPFQQICQSVIPDVCCIVTHFCGKLVLDRSGMVTAVRHEWRNATE